MESMRQNRRVYSVLATLLIALLMVAAMLGGLGSIRKAAAAPTQDDGRGQWTDTFTDDLGLDVVVNVVVNAVQVRLELEPPLILSQTDWSGGGGLLTATVSSTNQYNTGARVSPIVTGNLSLGFTLPTSDDVATFEQDGYPDLVMANYITGPGSTDFADASYLYYGSDAGFTDTNRSELSIVGAVASAVADLDNDGFLDIVFVRNNQSGSGGSSYVYIYWGSSDGYSESNRDEFGPAGYAGGCSTVADLDQDGYLDIVICNYVDASDPSVLNWDFGIDSYVYWGSSTGYTSTNRVGLPTLGAVAGSAADFDKDGHLDLVFSNYQNSINSALTATYAMSSYVYFGDGTQTGYTISNRIELPTIGAYGHSVADLDRDGYLDIVFSNRRTGTSTPVTATYELNSYVYWGSGAGFSETNRLELPTMGSYGNSLADLNGDGYSEIIFSNHYDGVAHNISSYIYWSDGGAFTTSNRSELPTIGATGNCVGDLDLNGYVDIVFSNRRSGDDHQVPSYIYWGSPGEYTTTNRTSLATHGALGCSIAGGTIAAGNTAYGNVYALPITGSTTVSDTATTPRIYATTGVITSTGFDSGEAREWKQIVWNASIPAGTNIALEVATSDDGSTWSAWTQVAASSADGTNSVSLSIADVRFIRYRATLMASTDHRQTPVLYDIQIIGGHTSGNATSVAIDPAVLDQWNVVTWTAQVGAGQAITVQVLDSSSSLIPDTVLPGNSSGFSSSSIDISALNVSSYPSLKLRAWFSSDSVTTTPSLDDWSVDWFATPTSLTISPESDSVVAGESISYTVTAHDDYNQSWDVTADSQYTITLAAGGDWAGNVYTSELTGIWTVTSTYGGLTATATLTVNPGVLHHIVISPGTATIASGGTQTYTAEAFDVYSNSLGDVTAGAAFAIEVGAGGSWDGNRYTAGNGGIWVVTGTYLGWEDTATLTVTNIAPTADDDTFTVNENSANGTVVGTVSASDPEGGSLSYAITAGNTGDAFAINGSTGQITVDDSSVLDYETTPSFNLTVVVTDTGSLTDSASITVNLNDVNEAPTVSDDAFTVDEGSANGTSVGTASASDPDAGDSLSYGITAGNTGDAFAIDGNTGEITVNDSGALDCDTTPSFDLTVVVTDTGGMTDTATVQVAVNNQAPTADAGGPYSGDEGSAISFDASGSVDPGGGDLTYAWDLDEDGVYDDATGVAFSYAWTQQGVLTVGLIITDTGGLTGTAVAQVVVHDLDPTAEFTADPLSGGEPLTVVFTDTSTSYDGITAWQWDLDGDGSADATIPGPTFEYTATGSYTVTLTVWEGDGDSDTETKVGYVRVGQNKTYLPLVVRGG